MIKAEIKKMHKVWDTMKFQDRLPTKLPRINFDEIISSVFTSGPFYYFIIDFFDMSITNLSKGFSEVHGIATKGIKNINDILSLIHPEDMEYVSKAEEKSYELLYNNIGIEKLTSYKVSYNFRCRTAKGNFELFNHQAIVLTMDENNNFIRSLNIMTNIHHLTKRNNYKLSLIGVGNEPSYLNLDVFSNELNIENEIKNCFSRREIEILKLLAKGLKTKEIGEKLFISSETVETHRKNMLKKSDCKNTVALVAKSLREGWV